MDQLVVPGFTGSSVWGLQNFSEGEQEHKTLMVRSPEAGPLFNYCFLVWLCVICYIMHTAWNGYRKKLGQEGLSFLAVNWTNQQE